MELVLEHLPSLLASDRRERLLYVLTFAVLTIGTLLCLAAVLAPTLDVLAVAVASAGAVAWLLSNAAGEGRTILTVAPGNGLTSADLATLPAAGLVGYLAVRRARSR